MGNLIKNLEKYLSSLNVEQLYKDPGHKKSKNWLAEVTAVLKVAGRRSYIDFKNLSQHIYPSIPLETRKHAAEQIDVFLRQIIAQYKAESVIDPRHIKISKDTGGRNQGGEYYINKSISEGFDLKRNSFNYQKLIALIEELNFNVFNKKTYSSCMTLRAILDHIPPLLAKKDFDDVVNNYGWGEEKSSRRKAIKELLAFRNTADDVLHKQITNRSDIIDFSYLPSKLSVNTLLQECLENGLNKFVGLSWQKPTLPKNENTKSGLIIDFSENKISWANYSISRWVWSSFKIVLSVNNFHNEFPEYIRAHLVANSNDGSWEGRNYIFQNKEDENKSHPNEEFRIEPKYKETVSLFVSSYDIGNSGQQPMPDIDRDTLKLVVETESGKVITLPIRAGWINFG